MATRRFPLVPVLVSTLLALVAATSVLVLFGDDGGSGSTPADGYALQETGALPASVEEVALGGLDGAADRVLGDFTGETPVVVNFFASWCRPCLDEMPAFEAVHQQLGDRVGFVGVANLDEPATAQEMVERTGVTYPSFADPTGSAITYFGGTAMPTTVFIDTSGEVVDVTSTTYDADELRQAIDDKLGVSS